MVWKTAKHSAFLCTTPAPGRNWKPGGYLDRVPKDPWGNPYQYLWLRGNPAPALKGERRRDKSMNPVNTDYDLYSLGADGLTAPQFVAGEALDDVVRANDGDFLGLAGDH